MMDAYMNGTNEESNGQKKRQSSSTSTIELMVYVDAGVQNDATQNGFSVVDYILGIINIVSNVDTYIIMINWVTLCRWLDCTEIQLCNIRLI